MRSEWIGKGIYKETGKRGKVVYRVRVRRTVGGDINQTFPTLVKAQEALQRIDAALESPRGDIDQYSLFCAIQRYRREVLPRKRPNTIISQAQQLTYWENVLGSQALASITPLMVSDCKNALLQRGLSGSTVNRYLAVLRHLYVWAQKDLFLDIDNPVARVRRCTEGKPRQRFLSTEEITRLLGACKASGNRYLYAIVLLAVSTGCRRHEITDLQWSQVSTDCTAITLNDTKGGSPRLVYVTGKAIDVLVGMRQGKRCAHCEYIFHSPNTCRPVSTLNAFKWALKRAELTDDVVFHTLRHTTASLLAMDGATLNEIGDVLGHKSLQVTQRYAHLTKHHTQRRLSAMTATLDAL